MTASVQCGSPRGVDHRRVLGAGGRPQVDVLGDVPDRGEHHHDHCRAGPGALGLGVRREPDQLASTHGDDDVRQDHREVDEQGDSHRDPARNGTVHRGQVTGGDQPGGQLQDRQEESHPGGPPPGPPPAPSDHLGLGQLVRRPRCRCCRSCVDGLHGPPPKPIPSASHRARFRASGAGVSPITPPGGGYRPRLPAGRADGAMAAPPRSPSASPLCSHTPPRTASSRAAAEGDLSDQPYPTTMTGWLLYPTCPLGSGVIVAIELTKPVGSLTTSRPPGRSGGSWKVVASGVAAQSRRGPGLGAGPWG